MGHESWDMGHGRSSLERSKTLSETALVDLEKTVPHTHRSSLTRARGERRSPLQGVSRTPFQTWHLENQSSCTVFFELMTHISCPMSALEVAA